MIYEYASEFQEAGHAVFGIHPFNDDGCECGNPSCKAAGKHPIISSWASINRRGWSMEQFDVMAEIGHFNYGFGVLCKNLIVVDVDARNGGVASYERLLEKVPELSGAGLIVNTGSGGGSKHLYFDAPDGVSLLSHLKDYPGVDFRSGPSFVVGPGSAHASGAKYSVAVGSAYDIEKAPAGLIELLKRPATIRVEYDGRTLDVSLEDVRSMLEFIPNNDLPYDDFIMIGMAIHHATAGGGLDLWDAWARNSSKYDGDQMQYWHNHFGKSANPVTVGTLIHKATENGWVRPVSLADIPEPEFPTEIDPFDLSDIDLRRPPGFVGEVSAWIASQPRRPRENIAVGAALVAVGNHIGLRMVDERDGVTGNLIAFNVAASASGKESVQQAFSELHRVSGMAPALHGNIKSDAEIYRNLIRHQAALYNTDEVSDFLEKLNNAKKKGGAAYLEGVIATVMSIFTKANGYALLTGDMKEEMKTALLNQIARKRKELDLDDDESSAEIDAMLAKLNEIDNGLKNPFLSMCGYGTNEKFVNLMDFRGATEGFFGRAMVFVEQETAPRRKQGYTTTPLPTSIKNGMERLYWGNSFDATQKRVEWSGARVKVPTCAEASELLDLIADYFDDKAIDHKEKSGLEALWLRGYEAVSKVSFILAAPSGLRTVEHVRWSLALVIADIERKSALVVSNDRKLDAPMVALMAKLKGTLEDWESLGVIKNRCRPQKAEDVEKVLDDMVEKDILETQTTKHPTNGKETKKYRVKRNGGSK